MSRSALKSALMDLKKHMRGTRASAYLTKGEDESLEKGKKPRTGQPGNHGDSELESLESSMGEAESADAEKAEGPVDFADEIKNFMKKQHKGKAIKSSMVMSMGSGSQKKPIGVPFKKKGQA
jgi:hypothetical protein